MAYRTLYQVRLPDGSITWKAATGPLDDVLQSAVDFPAVGADDHIDLGYVFEQRLPMPEEMG